MSHSVLAAMPIPAILIVVILTMLLFCELGFQIGNRVRAQRDKNASESIGPMVGGLLGMLGFVLAITFSMAASQHDLRKQRVVDEANAIGTTYLRTDLLEEPHASNAKRLLSEYVDIHLKIVDGTDLQAGLRRIVEIQNAVWREVAAAAKAQPGQNTALVVAATNEMIDVYEMRVAAGLRNRVPGSAWLALAAITLLTMTTMGIQVGLAGRRRLTAVVPLSLAFAVLVTLVVDLDRPQGGLIKVGQEAMVSLQNSIRGNDR